MRFSISPAHYFKNRPLLARLFRGAFWTLLGTGVTKIFTLATNIGIARILGTEDYGAYGILNATLDMFWLFGGLSLGYAMIKYTAEYRERDPEKAGRILSAAQTIIYISAGSLAIVLFLLSDHIAVGMLNRPDLGGILSLGAAYMFIRTINNVQLGTLAGFEAFRETARINIITATANPVITLPLVYNFYLVGAIWSLIVQVLLSFILCSLVFKKKCAEHKIEVGLVKRISWDEIKELFSFSIPAFIAGLFVIPVSWLTNALLVNQADGYIQLGLFNAANQWRQFIILIPTTMSAVMLAISADTYADGPGGEYRKAYGMNIKMTWGYALPAAIAVILLRSPLNLIFGARYHEAVALIPPLIGAALFAVINTAAASAVAGAGRMWAEVGINFMWATLLATLSFWLVPKLGGLGLSYAMMMAGAGQVAVRLLYIDRFLIHGSIEEFRSLAVLTAAVLGAMLFLTWAERFDIYWGLCLLFLASLPLLKKVYEVIKTTNIRVRADDSL
ncbi:MAG: oligosaccharide flippase family protein [Desulfobacterales bacterium]